MEDDESLVADASPLIILARIDRLDLLAALAPQVVVPRGVLAEVSVKSDGGVLAEHLDAGTSFVLVENPPIAESIARWELGFGETCVIAYALLHPETRAVLDDGLARRAAKRKGLLRRVDEIIAAIRDCGFRVSDALVAATLRSVGE